MEAYSWYLKELYLWKDWFLALRWKSTGVIGIHWKKLFLHSLTFCNKINYKFKRRYVCLGQVFLYVWVLFFYCLSICSIFIDDLLSLYIRKKNEGAWSTEKLTWETSEKAWFLKLATKIKGKKETCLISLVTNSLTLNYQKSRTAAFHNDNLLGKICPFLITKYAYAC